MLEMGAFNFCKGYEVMEKPIQILLTNDDGIQSPGLWAAAGALSALGYVNVVAPRDQFSGAGRSLPSTSDGLINPLQMQVNGKQWTVYSVGGTPAQAILHAICEILPVKPDLVVSGINYGENMGVGVTVSGGGCHGRGGQRHPGAGGFVGDRPGGAPVLLHRSRF
jgi:5'-nucleotidase